MEKLPHQRQPVRDLTAAGLPEGASRTPPTPQPVRSAFLAARSLDRNFGVSRTPSFWNEVGYVRQAVLAEAAY